METMRRFLDWLRTQDRFDKTYWVGLLMLFAGLTWGVSTATALIVVGAVVAGESVLTSYLAQWIKTRVQKERS
jgi:hypothetical protein